MHFGKTNRNSLRILYTLVISVWQITRVLAGILPLALLKASTNENLPASFEKFGYIEFKPNGTLILRSTLEKGSNLPNLMLLKTILQAVKMSPTSVLMQTHSKTSEVAPAKATTTFNIKIYGDGVEHKFPPFLERVVQRIQTFFSVYKYTDTSRPVHPVGIAALQEVQANIDNSLTTRPSTTTTTATAAPTFPEWEGSGLHNNLPTTTFINGHGVGGYDDYTEFIATGENDDYITIN